MALEQLGKKLLSELGTMQERGTLKGEEPVITGWIPPQGEWGPRVTLDGNGERAFLLMNSNSYLALSHDPALLKAAQDGADRFGTGPGAVRFISGTSRPHIDLEARLSAFHNREASMLFNAAYSAVIAVLPPLITEETLVISDEYNHNSIINALRLARPGKKVLYPHLSMPDLSRIFREEKGRYRRVLVITDGVFSMRGDCAPLDEITGICRHFETDFEEGVLTVIDDSHGVGASGRKGRGTEEHTGTRADLLIATLGKAFGVNGGYVASSEAIIQYLRQRAPFYRYSNPISPAEAAAAVQAIEIVDSHRGLKLLERLRRLADRLRDGLKREDFETLDGNHPIVPLFLRNIEQTDQLREYLFGKGILATGLKYPVVPKGDEEIRFQVTADRTEKDIDFLLETLQDWKN